jgi:hypothetical protein
MKNWQRWLVVVAFALAMAWVESAVVVYMRVLISRLDPYQPDPLPQSLGLSGTELVREVSTLVMLGAVGWLAGKTWRSRLGYTMVAFGVWDIFYYAWLKVICGWPSSLLGWDLLFLLPLPWWGPVLAPMLIAGLMIAGGTLVSVLGEGERVLWPSRGAWALNLGGALLALYVFMADALHAASGGLAAIRNVLPQSFNWPLFGLALALLAVPVVEVSRQIAAGALRGLGSPETQFLGLDGE